MKTAQQPPRNLQVPIAPRPRVKAISWDNGVKVQVCESVAEMRVRMDGLRKRGRFADYRAAERILDGVDEVWGHPHRTPSTGGAE